jgi:hypothetical protein
VAFALARLRSPGWVLSVRMCGLSCGAYLSASNSSSWATRSSSEVNFNGDANHPVGVWPGHSLLEFNIATGRTACRPSTCEQGLDTPAASRTSEPLLGELPAG